MTSNELSIRQPAAPPAPPAAVNDIDSWTQVAAQVIKLASEICNTPFVPAGLRGSAPATAAAILAGRELGLGPFASLGNIHVINGKTGLSALLMRALIQGQGHDWQDVEVSDTRVVVKGRRKGEQEWTTAEFTAAQAKVAKIDISAYPQDKLYARATARLARRKFADVIAGMPHSAEELEDEPPGETPAPTAPAKPNGRVTAAEITGHRDPSDASPAGRQDPPGPAAPSDPPSEPAGDAPDHPGHDTPDTPGTVKPTQLTAIWTILSTVYGFSKDEKDQARAVCGHIVSGGIESTKDMSYNEARLVLDTLSRWRAEADEQNIPPREYLIGVMAGGDAAGDE